MGNTVNRAARQDIFSFNTKDYKLPKGVTFDFDDGSQADKARERLKIKKEERKYPSLPYSVNQALPRVFSWRQNRE